MKITILFLIAITIIACNSEKKIAIEDAEFDEYFFEEKNIPVVKGKVLYLKNDELENTKIVYRISTPFDQNQSRITKNGYLNSDGTFELEIDYAFPYQQIWLKVGTFYSANIYANSDLSIELDAQKLRKKLVYMNGAGIKYRGTDGEVNTFLNNHREFKRKEWIDLLRAVPEILFDGDLEYETFLTKYDSLYMLLHKIDDEFIEKNPSPYSWLIKNERLSEYYGYICFKSSSNKSAQMNEILFNDIKKHKPALVSEKGSEFYKCLFYYLEGQAMKHDKTSFDSYIDYSKLSDYEKEKAIEYSLIETQIRKGVPFDTIKAMELSNYIYPLISDTLKSYKTLKTINYIDSLFNDSKADLLKLKFSSRDSKKVIFETTKNSINTKWCKEVLISNYEKSLNKFDSIEKILNEGNSTISSTNIGELIVEMPYGAKLYKVDGIKADEFLSNIKTIFRDKALILDFWNTSCAPCLGDMPYSKKLHDELKNEPLEFVYLCSSSGSSIEKWKSIISELEIGGTHLFVESSIASELMNLFSFNSFPSYAFIDRTGNYKAGAIARMSFLEKEDLKKLIGEE